MERPFRRVRQLVKLVAGGTALYLPPALYVSYKYRPRESAETEYHEHKLGGNREPTNVVEQWLLGSMRHFTVWFTATVFTSLMTRTQRIDITDLDKLHKYIDNDRDGVPLLTVANHCSVLDDPTFFSLLLPRAVRYNANLLKWSVCTEEICFKNGAMATYIGLGKGLPIQRGGSIYQTGLASLQGKLNDGKWVHLYPEARTWQEQGTPLRTEEGRWCSASGRCSAPWSKVGPFKWGVGKLVANAARLPLVVPIYHIGMHELVPQNRRNQLASIVPILSANSLVSVAVGDPVPVADLLEAYHAGARRRALQRNARRLAEYRSALRASGVPAAEAAALLAGFERAHARWAEARLAAPVTAAAAAAALGGGSGWLGWLSSWWFGAPATAAVPAAPAAAADEPATRLRAVQRDPALLPVNTVDAASDHTGASARVAGLSRALSPQEEREADAPGPGPGPLSHLWSSGVEQLGLGPLEAAALQRAQQLGTVARETANGLEARVTATARELELQAAELIHRLAELQRAAAASAAASSVPVAAAQGGGSGSGGEFAVRALQAVGDVTEAVDAAALRWKASVSFPAPKAAAAAAAPATAAVAARAAIDEEEGKSTSSGQSPRRLPAAPAAALGPLAAPALLLSDAPVRELIPTRTLRTGAVVPQFIEAPLRIKPADHAYLSAAEAAEEEGHRLQLYSDITLRLQQAVEELERGVAARRRAAGVVETRPQETAAMRYGPAGAAPALPGLPRAGEAGYTSDVDEQDGAW